MIVKNNEEEAIFKHLKVYEETTVLHPLNPKYPDIELKRGNRHRIVGKKRYCEKYGKWSLSKNSVIAYDNRQILIITGSLSPHVVLSEMQIEIFRQAQCP